MNDRRIAFYAALIACEGIVFGVIVTLVKQGASPWLGAVGGIAVGTLASMSRR